MEMLFSYWSIEIHEIIRGIPTVRDYGPRRVVSLPGITSALNLSSCFLVPLVLRSTSAKVPRTVCCTCIKGSEHTGIFVGHTSPQAVNRPKGWTVFPWLNIPIKGLGSTFLALIGPARPGKTCRNRFANDLFLSSAIQTF